MKEGRVLVVDDEHTIRETLGQVLSEEGYVVDLAVDGESALACVHAARPDAILLDLMMPGMNGRQFLAALRNDPAYAQIPVMIMTAVHGMSVNSATLGASEVVEKPFQVEELLNKVALAVYRSRDANNPSSGPLPFISLPSETTSEKDRGVVLVIEHDRARLQQLDLDLSTRGYTVVSMTRALSQLSRLARALRPRAILLDAESDGVHDVARELRELEGVPILIYSRVQLPNGDADLVAFVDRAK